MKRRAPAAQAPCALACLGDARLAATMPGLLLKEGRAEADPKAFTCCAGTGIKLLPDQDVTLTCELGARLKRVRKILGAAGAAGHAESADAAALPALTGAELAATLKRLGAVAKGESRRGLAYVTRAGDRPPPSMTGVALMAAWRFGLVPHLVKVVRGRATDLYPPKVAAGRQIVIVEGLGALWDPIEAETLDALVGYAYRSMTPLFLSLVFPEKEVAAKGARAGAVSGPRHTSSAFRARLAGVKARSPLAWLMPDCLTKLAAVTDGLKDLYGTTARPRGRPAATPRLPWDP